MKDFNVDSIHDEKMEKIRQLINSEIINTTGQMMIENEDELKGYIKALDWVMKEWKE